MSSSSVSLYFDWNKLPEDIFGFIMVKIGLESLAAWQPGQSS